MPSALRERYARFYSDTANIERRYSLHDRYVAIRAFVHAIDYLRGQTGGFDVNLANAQMILMNGIYNALDHRSTGREWRNVRHTYNNERDGPNPPDPAEEDRRCDNCGGIRPKPFSHCHAKDHLPHLSTTPPDFAEQARQLVEGFFMYSDRLLDQQPLVDHIASALAEAATQGQVVGFARAGSVAQMWATGHSCHAHDNDPCCHVRTGAEIERRINELSPDPSYPNRVRNEAATTALEQASRWQPIETAPKDGTRILVDFGRIGVHAVAWQQGVSGTIGWCVNDLKFGPYPLRRYISEDLKGWMPLPPSSIAAIGDDKE